MESSRAERNWIAIVGFFPTLNFKVCLVNVYNPCDQEERAQVWQSLAHYCLSIQLPCLLIGDFNEVLDPNERGSNFLSQSGSSDFRAFINNVHLSEVPAKDGWFTWFRGQAKSKLDRLLINPEWIEKFPALQVSIKKRCLSDHCPLLVSSNESDWGPNRSVFRTVG